MGYIEEPPIAMPKITPNNFNTYITNNMPDGTHNNDLWHKLLQNRPDKFLEKFAVNLTNTYAKDVKMCYLNGYLYAATIDAARCVVLKINIDTMAIEKTFDSDMPPYDLEGWQTATCIITDGTYIYLGLKEPLGKNVVKFDKDLNILLRANLSYPVNCLACDATYIYAGCSEFDQDTYIYKILKSDMTVNATYHDATRNNCVGIGVIDTMLLCLIHDTDGVAVVHWIDKRTMAFDSDSGIVTNSKDCLLSISVGDPYTCIAVQGDGVNNSLLYSFNWEAWTFTSFTPNGDSHLITDDIIYMTVIENQALVVLTGGVEPLFFDLNTNQYLGKMGSMAQTKELCFTGKYLCNGDQNFIDRQILRRYKPTKQFTILSANLAASRADNTDYENTTDFPMLIVAHYSTVGGTGETSFFVDPDGTYGANAIEYKHTESEYTFITIVPPGYHYKIMDQGGGTLTIDQWYELK